MYYKLFSVLVVFFLLFGAVNAKISEDDKASIERGLQQFSNDPQKLAVTLSVLNDRYDFSDEPEFRQKVISIAQTAGVDINNYPNLKEGKAPTLDDTVIGETVQEANAPEPSETTEIVEPVVEETENGNNGPIFFIIAFVVVVVIGVVIFVLRKKK